RSQNNGNKQIHQVVAETGNWLNSDDQQGLLQSLLYAKPEEIKKGTVLLSGNGFNFFFFEFPMGAGFHKNVPNCGQDFSFFVVVRIICSQFQVMVFDSKCSGCIYVVSVEMNTDFLNVSFCGSM